MGSSPADCRAGLAQQSAGTGKKNDFRWVAMFWPIALRRVCWPAPFPPPKKNWEKGPTLIFFFGPAQPNWTPAFSSGPHGADVLQSTGSFCLEKGRVPSRLGDFLLPIDQLQREADGLQVLHAPKTPAASHAQAARIPIWTIFVLWSGGGDATLCGSLIGGVRSLSRFPDKRCRRGIGVIGRGVSLVLRGPRGSKKEYLQTERQFGHPGFCQGQDQGGSV